MPLFQSARLLAKPNRLFGGKDAWKYLFRSLPIYPWSRHWANYLLKHDKFRQLLQLQPRLLFKLQRPYLRKEVSIEQKLSWLREHYDWLLAHWPWTFLHKLYQLGRIELARIGGEDGQPVYHLVLRPTDQCDKEGDLMLVLECAHQPLAIISFTVHRVGAEWVVSIGCLQGPRPELGREAVKIATQQMHGLRPKQAVLTALYALAAGYGIGRLHAVCNDSHIYQTRWRRRNRIAADYDSFWREMGGSRVDDSFHLPDRLARKAVADIPSRKRAQYRRRHQLEDSMIASLQTVLPACDRSRPIFTQAIIDQTGPSAD
ncbi:VirK/YbjX family protein [Chitinimonas arctica]|nr:DUF535 family protein [Chitinimonas arctica]